MNPEIEPNKAYISKSDVVIFRMSSNRNIIQEVYSDSNNRYGFRYQAWVAWRDSSKIVRDHNWWETEPEKIIVDNIIDATNCAIEHSKVNSIEYLEDWQKSNK